MAYATLAHTAHLNSGARLDRDGARADTAQLETGERVYGDYCASCHGDELRNASGGVTFDLRRLRASDHERFLDSVLNGKKQMPPWRGALQMEQIEAIWAYIRAKVDR
ncbi:MAG: c-type cytochrome [Xanthobacteraceae bacterium]